MTPLFCLTLTLMSKVLPAKGACVGCGAKASWIDTLYNTLRCNEHKYAGNLTLWLMAEGSGLNYHCIEKNKGGWISVQGSYSKQSVAEGKIAEFTKRYPLNSYLLVQTKGYDSILAKVHGWNTQNKGRPTRTAPKAV